MSSQSGNSRIICPSGTAIACSLIFMAPAAILSAYAVVDLLWIRPADPQAPYVAAFFAVFGISIFLLALYFITIRVELNSAEVIRSSAFGTAIFPIAEIESAIRTSPKGMPMLTIKTAKNWALLPGNSFSSVQLDEIQNFIVEQGRKISRTIQTSRPQPSEKEQNALAVIFSLLILGVPFLFLMLFKFAHSPRLH